MRVWPAGHLRNFKRFEQVSNWINSTYDALCHLGWYTPGTHHVHRPSYVLYRMNFSSTPLSTGTRANTPHAFYLFWLYNPYRIKKLTVIVTATGCADGEHKSMAGYQEHVKFCNVIRIAATLSFTHISWNDICQLICSSSQLRLISSSASYRRSSSSNPSRIFQTVLAWSLRYSLCAIDKLTHTQLYFSFHHHLSAIVSICFRVFF